MKCPLKCKYVNYWLCTLGTDDYSQSSPSSSETSSSLTQTPVQTPDNLALGGQAIQSSTYRRVAANAIDSLPLTCIRTLPSDNPWWRVDLLHSYIISRVVITNRPDCCVGRLSGAEIHIGNSLENNGNDNPRCAVLDDIPLGQSLSVYCDNMEGQYVNLIIPGSSKILSICEVEVYEKDLEKTFVMMQFLSSVNMTDPAVSNTILNQLKSTLTSKGLSDFTLTWTKLPQKVKPEIKLDGPCVKEPK
nr:fucolectin-like [Misgurnus anguillicaudatus]